MGKLPDDPTLTEETAAEADQHETTLAPADSGGDANPGEEDPDDKIVAWMVSEADGILTDSLDFYPQGPKNPFPGATRMISEADAALLLGIGTTTLAAWRADAVGPSYTRRAVSGVWYSAAGIHQMIALRVADYEATPATRSGYFAPDNSDCVVHSILEGLRRSQRR